MLKKINIFLIITFMFTAFFSNINLTASVVNEKIDISKFPLLESSLEIKIPNVDLSKIPDNRKISNKDIDYLLKNCSNLKKSNLINMTIFEMNEFLDSQPMTDSHINSIKSLYPELKDNNLTNWTVRDSSAYIKEKNNEPLEIDVFRKKGITDADVKYLLKEYHTFENLEKQSLETIIKYLEYYYMNKLYFAEFITLGGNYKELEKRSNFYAEYAENPPSHLQGNTYRWVPDVPYYEEDWFHEDSSTHIKSTREYQMGKAVQLYRLIFNTTATTGGANYFFTNLWGTWSKSQEGAHEGIDFVYKTSGTRDCYAVVDGLCGTYSTSNGCRYIKNPIQGMIFYAHMSNLTTSTYIYAGNRMGTQSNVGNADGTHLHFEVGRYDATAMCLGNDNLLKSLSPYDVI